MPYEHLTPMERGQLQVLYGQGLGVRAIARELGRNPSTVSRELARNHVERSGIYKAVAAQKRYASVRRACRRTRSLDYPALRRYVYGRLSQGWSPEEISGRLWIEHPGEHRMRVSHETIYRTLYQDEKFGRPLIGCLRQARPARRKRGGRKPQQARIPNRISIEERPGEVDALERFGDWEGDTIVGAGQKGAALTLVERKSMLLCAAALPSRHAQGTADAASALLAPFPEQWKRTLTLDNGSELRPASGHHQSHRHQCVLRTSVLTPRARQKRIHKRTPAAIPAQIHEL